MEMARKPELEFAVAIYQVTRLGVTTSQTAPRRACNLIDAGQVKYRADFAMLMCKISADPAIALLDRISKPDG
jgi:hypothetical protein